MSQKSIHFIRLHGPWHAGNDRSFSKSETRSIRFKVPGDLPDECRAWKITRLRRKWNRPPSGLVSHTRFFVIINADFQFTLLCNQSVLNLSSEPTVSEAVESEGSVIFEIPSDVLDGFNELELVVQTGQRQSEPSTEVATFRLTEVLLGIMS